MQKMMYPLNHSNAEILIEKLVLKTKLTMQRFENMFDFLSEEPVIMSVKEKENGTEEIYTCILRIRVWRNIKESCSWSIYSQDRQELKNIIVRKVIWDMDKDTAFAKKNVKTHREMVLTSYPSIATFNKYILLPQSNSIIQMIKNLDEEVENGFILKENENPTWEWRDLELLRLYDWGQIHFTWSTEKKNENVEKTLKQLTSMLDSIVEKYDKKIYSLSLNYSMKI